MTDKTVAELMALARACGDIERRACIGKAQGFDVRNAYAALEQAIRRAVDSSLKVAKQEPLTDAARDVLAERHRQIESEGWDDEHDDEHMDGSLAAAARCYVQHYVGRRWVFEDFADGDARYVDNGIVPDEWPWDEDWWKPKTPRRDLVRAAALILAEIERIDRAAAPSPGSGK